MEPDIISPSPEPVPDPSLQDGSAVLEPVPEPAPVSVELTPVAKLEALLFFYGEPITLAKVATLLGIKKEECSVAVSELADMLEKDSTRGLMLLQRGEEIQLSTKPALKGLGETIIKEEIRENLTPAALETLSLVAYLGPIPRSTVDYIRGVNSSFILRNLAMRGLVDREEKGNSYHYRASFKFLEHMGLTKTEDLPEYEHFNEILTRFESQATDIQAVESGIIVPPAEPAAPSS